MNAAQQTDLLYPDLVNLDQMIAAANAAGRDRLGKFAPGANSDRVDQPSIAWQTMAEEWRLVRDLGGGTAGMRLARTRWLPPFPKEKDLEYNHRIENSFLDEMFSDIVDETTAKPFSKAVSFAGTVPDWVNEFAKDVDGEGTTIHEFAKNHFRDALKWGKSHVAVDVIGEPDQLPDQPLQRDFEGARPRWRMIPGPNLLSWPRSSDRGRPVREVRFFERVIDASEVIELMHVWTTDSMAEHERSGQGNGQGVAFEANPTRRVGHRMGSIPFLTFYTKKTAEMMAKPPFMDVAWINVDHWQSYSDQRQILHTARVPLLFRKGFTKEEIDKGPVVVGARRLYSTTNKDAEMRYVEVSGAAMEEGYKHLQSLKEDAKEKGSKPVKQKVQVTAIGEIGADMKSSCDLQSWCEEDERVLLAAIKLTQKSVPGLEELPEDFRLRIFSDFDLRDRSADEMNGLRVDRGRGDVSRKTLWKESMRRGSLPEDFDMEEEEAELQKEVDKGMEQDAAAAAAMAEAAPGVPGSRNGASSGSGGAKGMDGRVGADASARGKMAAAGGRLSGG